LATIYFRIEFDQVGAKTNSCKSCTFQNRFNYIDTPVITNRYKSCCFYPADQKIPVSNVVLYKSGMSCTAIFNASIQFVIAEQCSCYIAVCYFFKKKTFSRDRHQYRFVPAFYIEFSSALSQLQ